VETFRQKKKQGREKKDKSLYRQTGRHVANRETFMETKDCRPANLYKPTEKCSNSQKDMQTDTKTGRRKERRTKRQKESKTGRKMYKPVEQERVVPGYIL